jgi:hypothetical protein
MPDQPTSDRLTSLLFNAITTALPADRFVALSERMAVAEVVRQVVEEQLGVSAMWEAGHAAGVAEGRRLVVQQLTDRAARSEAIAAQAGVASAFAASLRTAVDILTEGNPDV